MMRSVPKVELQFTAVIGGNDIATRAKARPLRIKLRFRIDQFVQPRDVFLRRDAPDARRR